jgi:hypothetical protein
MGFLGKKLMAFKKVAGVEAVIHPDGTFSFTVCYLELRNGVVSFQGKQENIDSLKELGKVLHPGVPVAIAVHGKHVLHKKVPLEPMSTADLPQLLKTAFPNLKQEEFYVQQYGSGDNHFLSLVRKTQVEPLLSGLKDNQIPVLFLTLGPFVVDNLLDFLKPGPYRSGTLLIGQTEVTVGEEQVVSFRTVPEQQQEEFRVGEEDMVGKWLLAYAVALHLLAVPSATLRADIGETAQNKEEWEQRQLFKIGMATALVGYFLLLAVNFFFFERFSKENAFLAQRVESQASQLHTVANLENKIKEKKSFLKSTGWLESGKSSFYADRLASSMPHQIQLLLLEIHPLDGETTQKTRREVFLTNTLFVKGRCREPQVLNEWLKGIRALPWVGAIQDQVYTFDEKERFGEFSFKVYIK